MGCNCGKRTSRAPSSNRRSVSTTANVSGRQAVNAQISGTAVRSAPVGVQRQFAKPTRTQV